MNNHVDGGEAVLEACRAVGMDYIISSPGSEWSPVWEALARQQVNGTAGPTYIDCWHETLAVDMALGYTLITGRPQAVLLHAGAGLLQGTIGLHAATLAEVPLLVMSGESLTYGESPDIDIEPQWYRSLGIVGGPQRLVEPLVKWANQVTSPHTLYESVVRAAELAQRTPMGPTYLCVPLETMLHPWTPPARRRQVPPAVKPQARAEEVEKVAKLLIEARNPVIIAESAGRDPQAFTALVELAELFGMPVTGGRLNAVANFPKSHALHLGDAPAAFGADVDLVLLLNCRSPWYPPHRRPPAKHIVAIGDNPLKTNMVYQTLHADLYLEGDLATSLRLLIEAAKAAGIDGRRFLERRARWGRQHAEREEKRHAAQAKARQGDAIDPVALLAAVGDIMPEETIYVDETITHAAAVQTHLPWETPQSYFRCFGGLGHGLGTALGIKLAAPKRPVALLVGDGSFLYNPMVQSLGAAKDYGLPLLVIILNNRQYASMRRGHVKYYAAGAAESADLFYGVRINGPDYAKLADLFGFHGERVDTAAALKPALETALRAVQEGRTAILNVVVSR